MRPAFFIAPFALVALACSGSARDPQPVPTQPRPIATQADAGAPKQPTGDEAAPQPLTRADCAELIAHIVELAVREDAAQNPEMPPPTDEALAEMRESLGAELEEGCVGAERGVYDCAIRAQTRDELTACDTPPA